MKTCTINCDAQKTPCYAGLKREIVVTGTQGRAAAGTSAGEPACAGLCGAELKVKTLGMDMQSWGPHARCAWLLRSGDGEGEDSDAGERLPPSLRESQRAEGLLVRL